MSATDQQQQKPDLEAFATAWDDATGFACGFANRQQQFFRWPEQRPQLEAWVQAHNSRHSAYIGWCLFSAPSRAADSASVLPGILIDLDLASGKHAKTNYAPSASDALAVLQETALPEPSRIISSGGGLYLHYLFNEPLILTDRADRARAAAVTEGVTAIVRNALQTQGWALDNVSDLARITRPVGTRNWKYDDLRVVELVSETRERLSVADYEMLIGAGAHRRTAEKTPATSAVDVERKGGEFALIEKHCGFVRRLSETPQDVSEPEWYAVATLAAHCEDGEDSFHRLSGLDSSRYREDDTAAKLRHAKKIKPRTCSDIETSLGSSACVRCLSTRRTWCRPTSWPSEKTSSSSCRRSTSCQLRRTPTIRSLEICRRCLSNPSTITLLTGSKGSTASSFTMLGRQKSLGRITSPVTSG